MVEPARTDSIAVVWASRTHPRSIAHLFYNVRCPAPQFRTSSGGRRDPDRLANEVHVELQKLRAEFYRDQRKQDVIVILTANAVLVSVVVAVVHLLTR